MMRRANGPISKRLLRSAMVVCALAAVVGSTLVTAQARADQTRRLEPGASKASFGIQHLLVAHANGSLPITAATVVLTDAGAPRSIEATLDPKQLVTGDRTRDRTLQGSDWFDTATYPTWIFASTSVEPTGADSWNVSGTLTIHGTAAPVVLAVRRIDADHYTAQTSVDRHAFGMHITRADRLVGNTATIAIDARLAPGALLPIGR